MRCHQATELMSLELDHMLDQAERYELDAHLATCPSCQQTWAAMKRVSFMLESAPMLGPAPGFAQRVTARIVKRQSRKQLMAGYTILVAGLLLLLALPLTYLAQPMSSVGQAVAQQPNMLGNGLQLLLRFGGILGAFVQACWVLIRAIGQAIPQAILLSSLLFAGGLVMAWFRLVSRQVVFQNSPSVES